MRKNGPKHPNNQDVFTFQAFHNDAVKVRKIAHELDVCPSSLLRDIVRFYLDNVDKEANEAYIRAAARLIDRDIQERIGVN